MTALLNDYNLPSTVDIYSDAYIKSIGMFPAIENVARDVYIIRNNEIVCTGRVGSSYMGEAIVYLENEEAIEVFKDDALVKSLGRNAPFPFLINAGWYSFGRFDDEDEERGVGLTVVDKFAFDFGIASTLRYAHIAGFGNKMTGLQINSLY